MMKIKRPIACLVIACALTGTAAGAVMERFGAPLFRRSEVRVVVDAGHGALGICFKMGGCNRGFV